MGAKYEKVSGGPAANQPWQLTNQGRQGTTFCRMVFMMVPRLAFSFLIVGWLTSGVLELSAADVPKEQSPAPEGITTDDVTRHTLMLTKAYLEDFRDPDTNILYGARLVTKDRWTSPNDVKAGKPKPWGYGSRIADTALHCGHLLVALIDAYEARPDPFLKENIHQTFAALKRIGSLPETHPKPELPDMKGLVPRGPHPDDLSAYYDDSSMDQHTTYIISLARYAASTLSTEDDRAWIRQSLQKVGHRLEKHHWSIKRGDGVTQAHVGFAWTGFNSDHASILLPTVHALFQGTGDKHWLDTYEAFLAEKNGLRWQRMQPGEHVRINAHPIYANQSAFRVHALFRMESDPKRKAVLRGLLRQMAQMQWQREFPGPFYRRFHSEQEWNRLRSQLAWKADNLSGCAEAWESFQPAMLEQGGLAVLAHVRFPLGGFHMLMLSEQPETIRRHFPMIWNMLTTVDLKKIDAGETNYLFTVVALHCYAFYFRHPELFADRNTNRRNHQSVSKQTPRSNGKDQEAAPPRFPIVAKADIGPAMDVATWNKRAFVIGRGKLSILDISDPRKPRLLGELSGLGHVRQIIVQDEIAYITSREDGLFLVDVKQPDKPRLLSHYDTIEFATGVTISGDVLFVACRHYGVELIDVSQPEHPKHLSTVRTGEAQSVMARGPWLYVGVWATSEVVTVDVSQPRHPRITARVELDGYGDGVDVHGRYLFAATGHHSRAAHRSEDDPGFGFGHGLEILDLANPARPRFLSRVKFPRLYHIGHDMWSVTVSGRHAVVGDTHNGLFVIDVSRPRHPQIIGRRTLPYVKKYDMADYVGGLALADGAIYAAGGTTDLYILDAPGISPPTPDTSAEPPSIPARQPRMTLDERFQAYRPDGQVHAVDFHGDWAVTACGSAGVHVVEIFPSPRPISTFATQDFATDVATSPSRKHVLIAAGKKGLLICAMSDRGTLSLLGNYRVPGQAVRQVEAVSTGKKDYALLQVGANNLHIVDITQPDLPKQILNDSRPGLLYGDQLMRGLVEDRYACAFWHVSGLHWYDMQGDSAPRYSGDNLPLRIGAANGLAAYQNQTLATLRGGYVLINRHERRPLAELPVRRIESLHQPLGKPTLAGDYLYLANRAAGTVTILNVADIDKPILIDQFQTPGNPGSLRVHAGTLAIPDGYSGLLLMNMEWP